MFWIEITNGSTMSFRLWNYEELDFDHYGSISMWDIFTNLHFRFEGLVN
jgi:hypothetical protein